MSAGRADVLVIGAGPAGAAAAITLARARRAVVLVDRARFSRDKTCGDGLTTAALRRLARLGLDPATVPSFTPVGELAVRSPSGRVTSVRLAWQAGVYGAVARREDLDAALVKTADAAGATVRQGEAIEEVRPDGAGIEVTLAGGETVRARCAVAADGAWSPTRRLVAGDTRRHHNGEWHAFRAYATGATTEAARRMWIAFDADLLPGYLWSFPVGPGVVNVGICTRRDSERRGAELAAAWRRVLAGPFLTSLLGPSAALDAPARTWPIPAGIGAPMLSALGGRILFAGDAARAADPFTGEGIGQALETGVLAAETIIASPPTAPEGRAERYAAAVARGLEREHAIASLCSRLLAHPRLARGAVRVTGLNDFTNRNVGRWLYEDVPRTIALTPSRWRRSTFRQPPPYP